MRPLTFTLMLLLCVGAPLQGESVPSPAPTPWDHITIPPMKTSIYIGSVKLLLSVFERQGSTLSATYEANVVPWFFWSETGRISITLDDAVLAKLAKGETAEFTGNGANQKNKPRTVTGRAQPANGTSGKIKVRVMADGIELIFNGTYQFGNSKPE